MRRGLLNGFPCGDPLAGFLPAVQGVVPGRRDPIGQDREGFLAWQADSASHPHRFALTVVALAEPPSVTGDRILPADIAAAGGPAGSPRVDVVFRLWQCDKENHGWREGRR